MSAFGVILASILSSGVIAALISSVLVDHRERWALRRVKIEEIFLCSNLWIKEVGINLLPFLNVCAGSISYNDALDMQIARGEKAQDIGECHLKMHMNIKMYEPTLIPSLESLEEARSQVNKVFNAVKSCYNETGQAHEFENAYREALLLFSRAGDQLEKSIIARGRDIGAERGLIHKLATDTRKFVLKICNLF